MIKISQVKMKPGQGMDELSEAARRILHLRENEEFDLQILKQSIDARKKPDISYVYTLLVTMKNRDREKKILKRNKDKNVSEERQTVYRIPVPGTYEGRRPECGSQEKMRTEDMQPGDRHPESGRAADTVLRPVVIGTGPAGLFCGLALARASLRPILIERGQDVDRRTETVEKFWEGGKLDPESNVQFGEGGAGTFSDGKLNTGVKDPFGRIRFVLDTFVRAGACPDILYSYKPHVGTDILRKTVAHIRDEITARGGEVFFGSRLTGLTGKDGVWDLEIMREDPGQDERGTAKEASRTVHLAARKVVLAIGHSSRDTFSMLKDQGIRMSAKAFAVGLRIQHPQGMINDALYGRDCPFDMPPAPYKLTHRLAGGRGVYSFCMCPGGYVVNASSEKGGLAVNGMSYHDRASGNANSAIVVTVSPDDIRDFLKATKDRLRQEIRPDTAAPEAEDVLCGVIYQRILEREAFRRGDGRIPVQTFGDYRRSSGSAEKPSPYGEACRDVSGGAVKPVFRGGYAAADVRSILPKQIGDAVEEGILAWGRQIEGFSDPSALLAGVESRTSSPVRIERGDDLQAVGHPGLYPCGEGAGYAGGITSAAVDGLRVAEAIIASAR